MTDQSDLLHTWQLTADSKLLRYYTWLYGAGTENLSFCKLFWAVVASPVALVIRAVAFVIHKLPDRKPKAPKVKGEKAPSAPPVAAIKFAAWLAGVADKIAAAWQPVSAFLKKHPGLGKLVRPVALVVGAAAVLGGLVFGFYEWNSLASTSLYTILIVIGIAIALFGIAIGIATLTSDKEARIEAWLEAKLTPIGHGFRYVYRFFAFGYHAIKTRTCPRVEILPAKAA